MRPRKERSGKITIRLRIWIGKKRGPLFFQISAWRQWWLLPPAIHRSNQENMALIIKQRAHEVIEAMSDDATRQELLCALALRFDVEAGLTDANARRVTDTDELPREYGLGQ
jgi:hypothetical protein